MTDAFIEYDNVSIESLGCLHPGRIKLSADQIQFRKNKTGIVETIQTKDVDSVEWIRLANQPAIRISTKDGNDHRFGGFKETDSEKVRKFVDSNWGKALEEKEFCVRGWNYGRPVFEGRSLRFNVNNKEAFQIPLQSVSDCAVGKNECTLQFHQNDEVPVSLLEMRFHVPTDDNEESVEEFKKSVLRYAGIVEEMEQKPIGLLEQILCTTPRGRYDIKVYPSHLSLHGKTFDYKIPIKHILRLFLLPHKDGRHMFFVMGLDPPIRQGQTRYNYLVLEFNKEDELELTLGMTDEQLQELYGNKLQQQLSGAVYEIVSKIMRALVNQKIIVPGSFVGHSGTPAVSCAYKSTSGTLYPLEKGFVYVHKPPMYIRLDEIATVNFARGEMSTRSFDFELELKNGNQLTFNSVEKDEYTRLFDFVNGKQLRIRNANKRLDHVSYKDDAFKGDSSDDDAGERDHYKERITAEAQEEDDSESEEDSDFDPEKEEKKKEKKKEEKKGSGSDAGDSSGATSGSEPDEEYDSDVDSGSSDAGEAEPEASGGEDGEKKEKPKKKKTEKSARTVKERPLGGGGERKKKRKKDENAPKRAMSAYFLWFNENRPNLKEDGMGVADVARKAGERWRGMSADDKAPWDAKAKVDKERYEKEMKEYKDSGAADKAKEAARASEKTAAPKRKKAGGGSGGGATSSPSKTLKSKEYVSSDDSSSGDDDDKPLKKKKHDKAEDDDKAEVAKEDDEEEEAASGSAAGSGSEAGDSN